MAEEAKVEKAEKVKSSKKCAKCGFARRGANHDEGAHHNGRSAIIKH